MSRDTLRYVPFHMSLFQLTGTPAHTRHLDPCAHKYRLCWRHCTDTWCAGISASEYTTFLELLLDCVALVDEHGELQLRELKGTLMLYGAAIYHPTNPRAGCFRARREAADAGQCERRGGKEAGAVGGHSHTKARPTDARVGLQGEDAVGQSPRECATAASQAATQLCR